jgi:hypothetical protein
MSKSSALTVRVPPGKFNAMVKRNKGGAAKSKKLTLQVSRPKMRSMSLLECWRRSIINPFENGGCKLGFGCLVPSHLVRAYLRTTVTSNADGSATVALWNDTNSFLLTYTVAFASVGYGSTPASDEGPISSNYQSGRIISGGIRAFPSIAMTAAPGICYSGQMFEVTLAGLTAVSSQDFQQQSTNHMEKGSRGAVATMRPMDLNSFIFSPNITNGVGYTSSSTAPWSVPYIVFSGLPASSSILVEAVLNLEVLEVFKHAVTQVGVPETLADKTLSDEVINIESGFRAISQNLPPAGQSFDAGTAFAAGATGLASAAAGAGMVYLRNKMHLGRPIHRFESEV